MQSYAILKHMKYINPINFSLILSLFAGVASLVMVTPALAQTYNNQSYYTSESVPTRVEPMSQPVVINRVMPGSAPVISNIVSNSNTNLKANTSVSNTSDTGSSGFGIFGMSTKTKELAISNIEVTSGPRNVNTSVSGANCGVAVSWTTTIPSVGQVLYGAVSQQSATSFEYAEAAVEGSSFSIVHSVVLPSCLSASRAYYFRVAAFTSNQYKMSDEQTILPLPIEVPSVASDNNSVLEDAGAASASVMSVLGNLLVSPITIIIVIALVIFLIVRKLWPAPVSHGGGGHGGAAHDEEALDEPLIAIPHH